MPELNLLPSDAVRSKTALSCHICISAAEWIQTAISTSPPSTREKGGVGLIYADRDGNKHAIPTDTVIQSIGYVPVHLLYDELCQRGNANVWNVGDSKMPANIMNAIKDGLFIGKDI